MKTTDEKIRTVIEMNTFWFSNRKFETTYEGYINALKENLLHLKNRVEREKLSVELIADFLDEEGKDGLTALLALTGFSYELLKRVFTFIRIKDAPELNALVYRDQWLPGCFHNGIHEQNHRRRLPDGYAFDCRQFCGCDLCRSPVQSEEEV